MTTLSLERIKELASRVSNKGKALKIQSVDFSKAFLHEEFTHLYYTPYYSMLSYDQKLSYNQLCGLRLNELFLTFENDFIKRVVRQTLKHPAVRRQRDLSVCLEEMIREEESHHQVFLDLNRACRPEIYNDRERYFTGMNWYQKLTFLLFSSFPKQLTFLYWLVFSKEEHSIAISQSMLRNNMTESLGELDDNFVAVHKEHLKDELRHIHIDKHLIRFCRGSQSPTLRKINAYLLKQFLKDIISPRGSSIAVLRELLTIHPELKPLEREMERSIISLRYDEAFQYSNFNREIMPHTFSLFDEFAEYHSVSEILSGYSPKT